MKTNLNYKISFLIFLSLILFFGSLVIAENEPGEGFRVNHSQFMQVNSSGLCLQVNNSNTNIDIFVPTNSTTELNTFYANLPSGVSAGLCSSYPARIAYWSGKVNKFTDINTGEWKTDEDCSSGDSILNQSYCHDRFSESNYFINSNYVQETITNWQDAGCLNETDWIKPSIRCLLCNEDYSTASACEGAPGYGCKWHSYGYSCSYNSCNSYTSSNCGTYGCYLYMGTCYGAPDCTTFETSLECTSESTANSGNCYWDETNSCCWDETAGHSCDQYYGDEISCLANSCQYYNGQCHQDC